MRRPANNILEDKQGEIGKSIVLRLSTVITDFFPHSYSFSWGVDEAGRVKI